MNESILRFPLLNRFEWLEHGFIPRLRDRAAPEPLVGLERLWRAEQVHGNHVERAEGAPRRFPQTDGIVGRRAGDAIGIAVADCCAIYLVEPERRAIGLLHSGREGTEANIAREGVRKLVDAGGDPARMTAALSPCIHACCYDVDFVARIEEQLRAEGVGEVWRHPDCTGCDLGRYYSYRKEKGKTGRMLAFMRVKS